MRRKSPRTRVSKMEYLQIYGCFADIPIADVLFSCRPYVRPSLRLWIKCYKFESERRIFSEKFHYYENPFYL